jgi:proteasome lid subunit RPN8/RPN11
MKAKTKSATAQPDLRVDSEVVRLIRQHARSSGKTEVCGVLIGQDRDQRIEVTACIEGQNADEAGAHVTFTQDTWEHIYAVKDKKYPNERIVGWYHSHPGFGIFLSDHDTFIHKNFFSSPGQVAWVFDPHSDEEGCFGWVGGRIERLNRIGVVDRRGGDSPEEGGRPEPVTSGHAEGVPALIRNEEHGAAPVRIRRLSVNESSDPDDSSLEQLVFKVFFSLTLLALGFALSYFLFPRMVIVPVALDPVTGQLVDVRTGEVIADPRDPNARTAGGSGAEGAQRSAPGQLDPGKSGQPESTDQGGKKGNNGKPN